MKIKKRARVVRKKVIRMGKVERTQDLDSDTFGLTVWLGTDNEFIAKRREKVAKAIFASLFAPKAGAIRRKKVRNASARA
jgi:hypothetical protein